MRAPSRRRSPGRASIFSTKRRVPHERSGGLEARRETVSSAARPWTVRGTKPRNERERSAIGNPAFIAGHARAGSQARVAWRLRTAVGAETTFDDTDDTLAGMGNQMSWRRNEERTTARTSGAPLRRLALALAIACCADALSGCASNQGNGALIGGGSGAGLGALIGGLTHGKKGAVVGGAVGAATGAGALIGHYMDKQEADLKKVKSANVERKGDELVIRFNSAILFDTGKAELKTQSQSDLAEFAGVLKRYPDTNLVIDGHTDSTGKKAHNKKLSEARAQAVVVFFDVQGIVGARMTAEGWADDRPVADNATEEGRAQNRRVEINIAANEHLRQQDAQAAQTPTAAP
jgi:outer membrane protein OmpA-like peptidoglycan-associated protein